MNQNLSKPIKTLSKPVKPIKNYQNLSKQCKAYSKLPKPIKTYINLNINLYIQPSGNLSNQFISNKMLYKPIQIIPIYQTIKPINISKPIKLNKPYQPLSKHIQTFQDLTNPILTHSKHILIYRNLLNLYKPIQSIPFYPNLSLPFQTFRTYAKPNQPIHSFNITLKE